MFLHQNQYRRSNSSDSPASSSRLIHKHPEMEISLQDAGTFNKHCQKLCYITEKDHSFWGALIIKMCSVFLSDLSVVVYLFVCFTWLKLFPDYYSCFFLTENISVQLFFSRFTPVSGGTFMNANKMS